MMRGRHPARNSLRILHTTVGVEVSQRVRVGRFAPGFQGSNWLSLSRGHLARESRGVGRESESGTTNVMVLNIPRAKTPSSGILSGEKKNGPGGRVIGLLYRWPRISTRGALR
jgi:hypothetical protein